MDLKILLNNDQQGDFLQRDVINYVTNQLSNELWVTVYRLDKGEWGTSVFFSGLIPNQIISKSLESTDWEVLIGQGKPGCSVHYTGDKQVVEYQRISGKQDCEPLIISRDFNGIKKDYVEISEEFRLFHNLFYDKTNEKYILIDDAGHEEDVVVFKDNSVLIKLFRIKQFLAIKEMHLAVYFSIDRKSEKTLEEQGLVEDTQLHKTSNAIFKLITLGKSFSTKNHQSFSRLEGKLLIPPLPKEQSGIWPYNENQEEFFEEFIIGIDENGLPVNYTSDPDELANYFGKNPHAPHYLTPVFFRREVLTKYYSKPEIYSVEDGYLRCGSLWGMQIDNNHKDFVIVFLGDLGRDLPGSERIYWKQYNIVPEGKLSKTSFRRSFNAEFAEPEMPDLIFKSDFQIFKEVWNDTYGWMLFTNPQDPEETNISTLHIPLSENKQEFDNQVILLAKNLLDTINTTKLIEWLGSSTRSKDPITLLKTLFSYIGLSDFDTHIQFLKDLKSLRTDILKSSAGQTIDKSKSIYPEKNRIGYFEGLVIKSSQLLKYLEKKFIDEKHDVNKVSKSLSKQKKKQNNVSPKDEKIDLAIITIIQEEHQAFRKLLLPNLKLVTGTEESPNLYFWEKGHVESSRFDSPFRIILTFAGSAGTNNSAIVTMDTIDRWRPRYVLLAGVAGGLPPQGLKKGDIVISSHIWGYEYGKIDYGFKPRPDHNFGADTGLFNSALAFSGSNTSWHELIDVLPPEQGNIPQVLHGPVASGDKVVDDLKDQFFEAVLKASPKLQAVEMEGAGAGAAIRNAHDKGRRVGFIMIRGISDMPKAVSSSEEKEGGQTEERDSWKKYASSAAACFSISFLKEAWPVAPREDAE